MYIEKQSQYVSIPFVVWIINHNLVNNRFMRDNFDAFCGVAGFLSPEEYLIEFTKFCIENGIKMSYCPWYKLNIENQMDKYVTYIKEVLGFKTDEEAQDFVVYFRNIGVSIKDLHNYLIFINEGA